MPPSTPTFPTATTIRWNFDLESFAESIEAVVKGLQSPDQMKAADRQ
jgi:hypothetical protein